MEFGGLLGLIIFILDIYAIVKIVRSRASVLAKLLWSLLVIVLPLIGLIIWWLAGPKD